ncbi:MAG: CFI-box-CTERM domain-containing protein [Dehalococcoidia bacterium]
MTRSDLRGRRGRRAAVVLSLLVLLIVLASGAFPAYANALEPPPQIPHYFTGTVSTLTGPVPEGTVVEAFVDGVKKAETTVNAESRYELDVPGEVGDEGKIISFKVAGIQTYETAAWESGKLDYDFNLTITALPDGSPSPFPFPFECFIATAAYGTPDAEKIGVLREFRDAVLSKNLAGRLFLATYYRLSPPMANLIAGNEFLRILARELLVDSIVRTVQATGNIWRK